MVESVIVLPVLLMLLFGVVEFGVALGRWQTLNNAAREGARASIVYRTNCDPSTTEAEVRQVVRAYAASGGVTVADTDIDVQGTCGASTTSSRVTVTVPYIFRVLPNMGTHVNPTINLIGTSSMRNEGTG